MAEGLVSPQLALELIAELSNQAAGAPSVQELLERALALAIEIVPGCEQAGISVLKGGRIDTPASVGDLAAQCDKIQERNGAGPCITALLDADTYRIDDLNTDDRWPSFAAEASVLGLRSMYACRLATPRDRLAALNLYSTRPHSFTDVSEALANAYATHVGLALSNIDKELNLRAAMESRELIGQAMGILMERHRLAATQAFDLMVQASQVTNVKLRVVAEELVRTGTFPG
ncbi:GAF and ANTAR domain-containing protein [Jatrophihabitans sp.]|uniref:GAF and ANTAR domain-containing protein n=1 Tax=Jatrophihabitans sp. TaxID=1932789 RepID=UPI0030C72346|nr:hypothetical protein [Jatrophihabitans sp.]